MTLRAVLLAAGEGSRMRPLTDSRPKVLLPVAGKPILEHLIIEMKKAGVAECLLVTGYRDDLIREYFGDGSAWGLTIRYLNQPEQGGTGDAVRMAEGSAHDRFLVANGDILIDHRDIVAMASEPGNTMGVFKVNDPTGLGVIEVEGDRVTNVLEKVEDPPTNLANAGFYLFTPDIFQAINETPLSERGEYELTKSIQLLIDGGTTVRYRTIERWLDASYPWDLLRLNETLLKDLQTGIEGTVEAGAVIKGTLRLGTGSVVRSGSYIVGPVTIGKDCEIGPNCYLRPGTSIGNGCHIGASVEVKNSIIMNGSKVPHLSYVGDSVIGENCNLGAGTKVANLKLDKKNISVGGIATGRRKLGVIMGDNVQTGINASINVGTVIGSGSLIGPGSLANGGLPARSKVFASRRKTRKQDIL